METLLTFKAWQFMDELSMYSALNLWSYLQYSGASKTFLQKVSFVLVASGI
jgi:hypothetical protein